jgi:hypothetical protein
MAHAILTFGAVIGLLFFVALLMVEIHAERSNRL